MAMPKNVEETLAHIEAAKEKGNEYFKAGDYKKALQEYVMSTMFIKSLLDDPVAIVQQFQTQITPQQKEIAISHAISINNNAAAVNFKLERWDKVIKHASQVLKYDSTNVKALYRRGKAELEVGKIDEAEEDLMKAIDLQPDDSAIKREIALLRQKLKEQEEKQKHFYGAMFS